MKNKLYDSMISDITQEQLKNMFDYDDVKGILIRKEIYMEESTINLVEINQLNMATEHSRLIENRIEYIV